MILVGDAIARMRELPDGAAQCCVTSPPYWGLRDYGCDGQLGLESTPEEYIGKMVAVFREVRRVLRDDGTLWLNLGSSYASGGMPPTRSRPDARSYGTCDTTLLDSMASGCACSCLCDGCLADYANHCVRTAGTFQPIEQCSQPRAPTSRDTEPKDCVSALQSALLRGAQESTTLQSWLQRRGVCLRCDNRASALSLSHSFSDDVPAFSRMTWLDYTIKLKQKDLIPIPWMVAMALQADGWWLRQDIIWHKPNPMPESVTDRCTKAHEYVFLLTKRERYYYDAKAIAEPSTYAGTTVRASNPDSAKNASKGKHGATAIGFTQHDTTVGDTRNARDVWTIGTEPFSEAHFATMPSELARRCIKAGTSERGCCEKCGAPWQRDVERSGGGYRDPIATQARRESVGTDLGRTQTSGGVIPANSRTVGWSPTCACNAGTVPCVVLDPFFGAGTTGLAASQLGRGYIGVELNPEYAAMAEKRIAREMRPGTFVDDVADVDAPLFGSESCPS